MISILGGFALRLVLLNTWPLREDEALYAFWARHFWSDPRFLSVFPDKPPLFIWLQAFALEFFGATSSGVRVLGICASTITIALVVAASRRMWRSTQTQLLWAAVAAGLLIALNPFAIAFAATGYTDSLLVAFGTAAVLLALRRHPTAAGALLGAAIMTKQQGLLYAPLVVALALLAAQRVTSPHTPLLMERGEGASLPSPKGEGFGVRFSGHSHRHTSLKALGWLTLGTLLIVAPVMLWDASRWATAPSPWALASQNYAALTFASPSQWLDRAADWLDLLWYGAASTWAWLLLGLLVTSLGWGWTHMRSRRALDAVERWSPLILALWLLAFLAAHLFSTVQPWDRYLLPIWPVLALLLGGGAGWFIEWLTTPPANHSPLVRLTVAASAALALLVLLPPALHAARGQFPIGADHGDYAGLDQAAHWVATQPDGAISVYHRALGWNLDFALYDAVESGKVELRWYPSAVYLADNVTKNPARRSLVVEPDWAASRDLVQQAAVRGLAVREVARFDKVAIFEVAPASVNYCEWCVCRLPQDEIFARRNTPPQWESMKIESETFSPVR